MKEHLKSNELDGRVAVVTGGATLLGEAISRALVTAGAKVLIGDCDPAGQGVAEELGPDAAFVRTDVISDTELDMCLQTAENLFGGIDILVNGAAIHDEKGVSATREEWLRFMNVNLVSPVLLIQKVLPYFQTRGGGAVVNVASGSAKQALPDQLLYPTSKAALLYVTRGLALNCAPLNVRVNSISPGIMWSSPVIKMTEGDRSIADQIASSAHIIPRCGTPEELGDAVVFLCSSRSSFITGADLAVDGGGAALGAVSKASVMKQLAALYEAG